MLQEATLDDGTQRSGVSRPLRARSQKASVNPLAPTNLPQSGCRQGFRALKPRPGLGDIASPPGPNHATKGL